LLETIKQIGKQMASKSYQDLVVWQRAMDLVEEVYRLTQSFPKEEMYGLTSQIRRAVVSIPSNIAEGQAQGSDPAFIRFLSIAQGSLKELETQLLISERLKYTNHSQLGPLLAQCDEIGKMLTGLQKSLRNSR
jgi:four helix bundle protein